MTIQKLIAAGAPISLRRLALFGVLAVSCLIMIRLSIVTRDMTCIPTDAQALYQPAAKHLAEGYPPSELHNRVDNGRFMFGKEMLIMHFVLAKRILNDQESLWPLTLVCILAWGIASVLVFSIAWRYWGLRVGLVAYVLFVTSFWPYLYVLMVKHPAVGICYFLLAVACFQRMRGTWLDIVWAGLSGVCWATAFFSSTVTAVWLPLYVAAFGYQVRLIQRAGNHNSAMRAIICAGELAWGVLVGFFLVAVYINYPHVLQHFGAYWKGYWAYIHSSSALNLFYVYQDQLRTWGIDSAQVRGGWLWTFRYLSLVMPVLFPVFIFCMLGLLAGALFGHQGRRGRWMTDGAMVLLSVAPLCLMEWKGIAQYGANYFAAYPGILMLVAYAIARFVPREADQTSAFRWKAAAIMAVLAFHVAINAQVFFSDVLPTRLTTTRLARELKSRGINAVSLHYNNYMVQIIVGQLRPDFLKTLRVKYIDNVFQAKDGYILIPPVIVNSIYFAAVRPGGDFDEDLYLNGLIASGAIEKYAVLSMDTMATSRIWRHETEITSYLDLISHQYGEDYQKKSRLWLLDAKKLYQDREKNPPVKEDVEKVRNGVRDIGVVAGKYRYKGLYFNVVDPLRLEQVVLRLYKVGDPRDGLVAYVYKRTEDMRGLTYVPAAKGFFSEPVTAGRLSSDPQGQDVVFRFKAPIELSAGDYSVLVYRTGELNDHDFYRVYVEEKEKEFYIKAAGVR